MNDQLSNELITEGVAALQQDNFELARDKFKKSAQKNPRNVDAYYNLGAAELNLGNPQKAIAAYKKALTIAPTDYEVLYNLGTVYLGIGEVDKAIDLYNKTLEINPYYVNALNNLGVAYQYIADLESSHKIYEQVIKIKPEDAIAHNNLGVTITKLGLPGQAVPHFQQALSLNPDYASAYNNLGNALQQLGSYEEAQSYYQKALELEPNYVEALINTASNYQELRDLEASIDNYRKALAVEPQNKQAIAHLLHIYQQTCSFAEIGNLKQILTLDGQDPLINIMYSDNLANNLQVAKFWSRNVSERVKHFPPLKHSWPRREKINIGYMNNFQDKPVGYLIRDMFKLHDRKKFEVFAFSHGSAAGGDLREQVAKDVDHFIDIANYQNYQAARLINEKEIDILIDLKGYTKGERMEVLAHRPSPIQITYLGFPGTTGADFFDYIITDKILTPKDTQKYYTEKFLYMPNCYQVYSKPRTQKINVKRNDYNLPKNKFIFSSLNQTVKITQELFYVWLAILKAVPNSVFWLLGSNDIAVNNLRDAASQKGIGPDRLIFANSVPFEEHMSRIALADLALDPFAYSGGATTAHTLWSGVPVVTKIGKHYLSRMSSSIVTNADLPDLVVKTNRAYTTKAIELAKNPQKLKKLVDKLKNNKSSLLFDTNKWVSDLETNLTKIYNAKFKKKQQSRS